MSDLEGALLSANRPFGNGTRLVVIADDLSGAADTGVAFSAQGYRTSLSLARDGETPIDIDADVVCIDGHSRALPRAEAVEMSSALTTAHAQPGTTLLRKIDSTLRGHVAAELAASLQVRARNRRAVAIFASAFPARGRTVLGGHAFLRGQPLEQSETWLHERLEGNASIPAILEAAGLCVVTIGKDILWSEAAPSILADFAQANDVLAFDAEIDADLDRIVQMAAQLGKQTTLDLVWVGSSGLARALAGARKSPEPIIPHIRLSGPPLFVVGSVSAVSRRQVEALMGLPGLARVDVPAALLLDREGTIDWNDAHDEMVKAVAEAATVLVVVTSETEPDLRDGRKISAALGRLLAPQHEAVGALVATGGETARAVLDAFGIDKLRIIVEIEPGIPLSLAELQTPFPVITKAGAFGADDALLACHAALLRASTTVPVQGDYR